MNLHPIFGDLCRSREEKNDRYDLSRPWVTRGWVCATDGRMIVRTPLAGCDHGPLSISFPGVLHLFEDGVERVPVNITGLPVCDCPECFGGCSDCWGTGEIVDGHQLIGGSWINSYYLSLLRKHGVTAINVGPNDTCPVMFCVGGTIAGVLAPMNRAKAVGK